MSNTVLIVKVKDKTENKTRRDMRPTTTKRDCSCLRFHLQYDRKVYRCSNFPCLTLNSDDVHQAKKLLLIRQSHEIYS